MMIPSERLEYYPPGFFSESHCGQEIETHWTELRERAGEQHHNEKTEMTDDADMFTASFRGLLPDEMRLPRSYVENLSLEQAQFVAHLWDDTDFRHVEDATQSEAQRLAGKFSGIYREWEETCASKMDQRSLDNVLTSLEPFQTKGMALAPLVFLLIIAQGAKSLQDGLLQAASEIPKGYTRKSWVEEKFLLEYQRGQKVAEDMISSLQRLSEVAGPKIAAWLSSTGNQMGEILQSFCLALEEDARFVEQTEAAWSAHSAWNLPGGSNREKTHPRIYDAYEMAVCWVRHGPKEAAPRSATPKSSSRRRGRPLGPPGLVRELFSRWGFQLTDTMIAKHRGREGAGWEKRNQYTAEHAQHLLALSEMVERASVLPSDGIGPEELDGPKNGE